MCSVVAAARELVTSAKRADHKPTIAVVDPHDVIVVGPSRPSAGGWLRSSGAAANTEQISSLVIVPAGAIC